MPCFFRKEKCFGSCNHVICGVHRCWGTGNIVVTPRIKTRHSEVPCKIHNIIILTGLNLLRSVVELNIALVKKVRPTSGASVQVTCNIAKGGIKRYQSFYSAVQCCSNNRKCATLTASHHHNILAIELRQTENKINSPYATKVNSLIIESVSIV